MHKQQEFEKNNMRSNPVWQVAHVETNTNKHLIIIQYNKRVYCFVRIPFRFHKVSLFLAYLIPWENWRKLPSYDKMKDKLVNQSINIDKIIRTCYRWNFEIVKSDIVRQKRKMCNKIPCFTFMKIYL